MMSFVFLILFLACACFALFISWHFKNKKVEDVSIKLSIALAITFAIVFITEIILYIIEKRG